ncbi:MAG: amidohydrolase family protein [Chloroflexi bacterium]|nr:amidohydrolase family protein [Chloroflexota bacterium]
METFETNFVKRYEPGTQARVELVNGRILDVVNGRYFDTGTRVILQGGKIESMPSTTGEPTGIEPDYCIDLQGKAVLPSLYNTHIHLLMGGTTTMTSGLFDMRRSKKYREQQKAKHMAECLAHGITHVRDAWQPDLRKNRVLREQISKGEIPGPRILQSVAVGLPGSYLQEKGSLIGKFLMPSADPLKEYAGAVAFPMDASEKQVRDAVDRAIDERGAEAIKIGDEAISVNTGKPIPIMTIEQLCALADQARRRGVQSTMHHSSVESFRRGVKAGVSSLAHCPMDALLTREDIETFKASGCLNDPTISAFYAIFSWKLGGNHSNDHPELDRLTEFRDITYTFATIADEYYIPELRAVVMNGYKQCTDGKPKLMGIIDASGMLAWDTKAATLFENFCLLYKHGVPMATGNDTMPPCTPAMVGLELSMFDHVLKGDADRASFSGADAVKIATINSARSLGLDEEFGSVESGKTADLILLDGDPLEDFRVIGRRVDALFMDGKLVINNCGLKVESNGK